MVRQLLLEVAVVAITLGVALGAVASVWPLTTARSGFVAGLALGALFHLAFELLGTNALYCRVGHACTSS